MSCLSSRNPRTYKYLLPIFLCLFVFFGCLSCSCRLDASTPLKTSHALILRDVHPLFGGRNVFIHPHVCYVQSVNRIDGIKPFQEMRVSTKVSSSLYQDLLNSLSSLSIKNNYSDGRMGLPDEAMANIIVIYPSGEVRNFSKWKRSEDPAFDSLYQKLVDISELCLKTPAILFQGRYDPFWKPNGLLLPDPDAIH